MTWTLVPVPGAAVTEVVQCDAGNCPAPGSLTSLGPGDCPATTSGACALDDAKRVQCWPLDAYLTCFPWHRECKNVLGLPCWIGELYPVDGDVRDVYRRDGVPAGTHRFVMTQPATAPHEYTLCVQPPEGQVASRPVARNPLSPAQLAHGVVEVVESTSAVAGTWYVAVLAGSSCPGTLEGAAGPSAEGPGAATATHGALPAWLAQGWAAAIPGGAIASCHPTCQSASQTAYCLGTDAP